MKHCSTCPIRFMSNKVQQEKLQENFYIHHNQRAELFTLNEFNSQLLLLTRPVGKTVLSMCSEPRNTEANQEARKPFWLKRLASNFHSSDWAPSLSPVSSSSIHPCLFL